MKSYCEHCGKVHDLDAPHLGMKTKHDLPKIPIPPDVIEGVLTSYERTCNQQTERLDLSAMILEMGDAHEVCKLLEEMREANKKWAKEWRRLALAHEVKRHAAI
jgi:hypothetical protein